jgi:hypothetical protein
MLQFRWTLCCLSENASEAAAAIGVAAVNGNPGL